MTSAREDILARIRAAAPAAPQETPITPAPATAPMDVTRMLDLFVENVRDYKAVVVEVHTDELQGTVQTVLDRHDAKNVIVSPDLEPQYLPTETSVIRDSGQTAQELDGIDAVITTSKVGIADTGTIVLDHSGGQGRRALSLVPDVHVCIVHAADVVASTPEAVAALEDSIAAGLPQTWIAGPSATSDIELNRVEGVHGPRNLEVILVHAAAQ